MSVSIMQRRLAHLEATRGLTDVAHSPAVIRFYHPTNPPEAIASETNQSGPCVFWLPFNGRENLTNGGVDDLEFQNKSDG